MKVKINEVKKGTKEITIKLPIVMSLSYDDVMNDKKEDSFKKKISKVKSGKLVSQKMKDYDDEYATFLCEFKVKGFDDLISLKNELEKLDFEV